MEDNRHTSPNRLSLKVRNCGLIRICINATAFSEDRARGSGDVLSITNRQYGDPKSEGGGDELRMCHRLTEIPRPREIEVDRGKFRREFVTMLPGNQVRRGSEQPDRGCWMPWDFGTEKAGAAFSLMTSVHRGRAHYSGIPGNPPIWHTISKCSLFTG